MKTCENCGSKIGTHGCTWCNEESYIADQYFEEGMPLPDDETDFMKKYYEQQSNKQHCDGCKSKSTRIN